MASERFQRCIDRILDQIDDLRDFKKRTNEHGYTLERIVTHASAIGRYFKDPENNTTEVF